MKSSLAAGLAKTKRLVVDRDRTISFMGEDGRVYATPELVRDIEVACREFILEHADEGEDSVGTRVELNHLAPTPLGLAVEITTAVEKVEGRLVTFAVTARDPIDEIATGRHTRFVADVAKTRQRLAAKAAKAKAA